MPLNLGGADATGDEEESPPPVDNSDYTPPTQPEVINDVDEVDQPPEG